MATSYAAQATVTARIKARYTRTDELATANQNWDLNKELLFPAGDLISKVYSVTIPVGVDFPVEVPISPGDFTDAFGQTIEIATVRAIMIHNGSSTNRLRVGNISDVGDSEGAFWRNDDLGGGVVVAPGGQFILTAPLSAHSYGMNGDLQLQGIGGDVLNADIFIIGS